METPAPPPPTTTTTAVKPDPDSDSPQSNTITNNLPPPLTNGLLKRHKPLHHHHQSPPTVVSYKECLKNHAASMGGHAIDGCGEFMPSPTSSPTYPTSLKCAACGCHRNFHRRDHEESLLPPIQHLIEYQPLHRHHPPPPPPPPPPTTGSPGNSPSPPPISSSYYPRPPPPSHLPLALTTLFSHPPSDTNHIPATPGSGGGAGSNPSQKKRFRTKFTQDQKEKMYEIAERVDWKVQKNDEEMIVSFCNQIGVDKSVFKVWMHNNKTTFGNKKLDPINNNIAGNEGIDFIISRSDCSGGNVVCNAAKGSSSSS